MKNIATTLLFILLTTFLNAQYSKENFDITKDVKNDKKGLTEVYFVGAGDIQLALAEGRNIAANTGLGVIFWRIWDSNKELQLETKVNVASTADTLSASNLNGIISGNRTFGNFILAPNATGQGTYVNSLWYNAFDVGDVFVDGIQISALASNHVWKLDEKTVDPTTGVIYSKLESNNVSLVFLRVGLFHEFVPEQLRREKGYSIRFGVNYNLRSIQGDVGQLFLDRFRQTMIGTKKRTFHGGEFLVSLRLKNLQAEASLPFIKHRRNEPVAGLSGVQFVTSISFVGGFPLALR